MILRVLLVKINLDAAPDAPVKLWYNFIFSREVNPQTRAEHRSRRVLWPHLLVIVMTNVVMRLLPPIHATSVYSKHILDSLGPTLHSGSQLLCDGHVVAGDTLQPLAIQPVTRRQQ